MISKSVSPAHRIVRRSVAPRVHYFKHLTSGTSSDRLRIRPVTASQITRLAIAPTSDAKTLTVIPQTMPNALQLQTPSAMPLNKPIRRIATLSWREHSRRRDRSPCPRRQHRPHVNRLSRAKVNRMDPMRCYPRATFCDKFRSSSTDQNLSHSNSGFNQIH
jgi:hypothetical protein